MKATAFLLTALIAILALSSAPPVSPVDDSTLGVVVDDGVPF